MSERPDMVSPGLVQANIQKTASLYLHCVPEPAKGQAVDFDLLNNA